MELNAVCVERSRSHGQEKGQLAARARRDVCDQSLPESSFPGFMLPSSQTPSYTQGSSSAEHPVFVSPSHPQRTSPEHNSQSVHTGLTCSPQPGAK
jgi:hypothetical protein